MSFLGFFKYVLFIFNFLVMLFGLAVIGLSVFFYVDTLKYGGLAALSWPVYSTVFIIVIGIGLLTLIIGFFGCCGACKESSCMLCLYFTICVAICALGGALVYLSEQNNISAAEIKYQMQQDIKHIIQRSYNRFNETSVANIVIDKIQEDFQCCGSNNFTDWANSAQNNATRLDIGVNGNPNPYAMPEFLTSSRQAIVQPQSQRQSSFFNNNQQSGYIQAPTAIATFRVPTSCCSTANENAYNQCKAQIARYDTSPAEQIGQRIPHVNQEGCVDKIYIYLFRDNRWPLNIIGGLAIGLQGLSLIFSCCLCCAINRAIDDDDDDEQK